MSDMAKKAREAMKSKARRLASEKDGKVDSSNWTPAEPLNADVKTGMRPISRRAYKSGGAVEGSCAPKNLGRKPRKAGGKAEEKAEAAEYAKAKINRDAKAANEEREGIKHIGGLKKGGRAKKQDGGESSGQSSGIRSRVRDLLKKVHPGDAAVQREQLRDVGSSQTSNIPAEDRAGVERMSGSPAMKKGGRAKKMMGGPMADPRMNMVKPKAMEFSGAQGTPYKKGGKAERIARKSGGRAKGKTNINIVIGAPKAASPEAMGAMGGPPMPPGGVPVPLPAAGGLPPAPMGGLGAMGGMPMPPAPPAMPGRPMARKAGGRVAKSYKDMTAGAGSGVGRLQKTEIESRKG